MENLGRANSSDEDDMTRSSPLKSSSSDSSLHHYTELMTEYPELPGQCFEYRVEVPTRVTAQLSQLYNSEDDMTRSPPLTASSSESSMEEYAEGNDLSAPPPSPTDDLFDIHEGNELRAPPPSPTHNLFDILEDEYPGPQLPGQWFEYSGEVPLIYPPYYPYCPGFIIPEWFPVHVMPEQYSTNVIFLDPRYTVYPEAMVVDEQNPPAEPAQTEPQYSTATIELTCRCRLSCKSLRRLCKGIRSGCRRAAERIRRALHLTPN